MKHTISNKGCFYEIPFNLLDWTGLDWGVVCSDFLSHSLFFTYQFFMTFFPY